MAPGSRGATRSPAGGSTTTRNSSADAYGTQPVPARADHPDMDEVRDRPVVLVAEDDEDIRDLLRFGLGREGYRVVAATDGLDALRAITAERPDLVLLDIAMPRLDGKAVCRILQAKG